MIQSQRINNQKKQETLQKCKKKQVKILSGFFPVFFYFPVEFNSQTVQIRQKIMSFLTKSDIQFQQLKQTHITITKTINILQNQVKEIQQKIEKSLKGRIHLPIVLLFKKVTILQNFICLQVQKVTSQRLKKVTEFIGESIPNPYFDNPIYHVSLFKLIHQPTNQLRENIRTAIEIRTKTALLLSNLYLNSGIKKIKLSVK